jgi:hypothetical protein
MKSLSRIQKLLALAASAAIIGSACEAEAALSRAMIIAAEHSIEIAPLAAAAGVRLPPPPPLPALLSSSVMETGRGGTLTRTIDRAGTMEVCTLNGDGRTEVYAVEDDSGIRAFIGYVETLDADTYEQFHAMLRVHWHTHDTYHRAAA